MATNKKLLQAAAAAGDSGLNIEDVFSTYLYDGNGSTQTITNGINLSDEGGLVWIKSRSATRSHVLWDSERTGLYPLFSDLTNAEGTTVTNGVTSLNSNGFSLSNLAEANLASATYCSWTWRKAPRFFDCVTYSGTGSAQNISHDLNSVPACIMVKRTDDADNWAVYHRGMDASAPEDYYMQLNTTDGRADSTTRWNDTAPTSSQFTVGSAGDVNASGGSYVAYLFAHNDGDGTFGPDGNADVIKCGSFTDNGGANSIDLGFEPQFVIVKSSSNTMSWVMFDAMRGMVVDGNDALFTAQTDSPENAQNDVIDPTPTGFTYNSGVFSSSGWDLIYIAIRRGPMAVPENADDVFAIDDRSGGPPNAVSGFPVDMAIFTNKTVPDNKYNGARLIQGNRLYTNLTDAEGSSSELAFDYNTGFIDRSDVSTENIHWMWRRAPNFCDVVCYEGDGVAGRTVSHNLGVVPEMMWVKSRSTSNSWNVYHSSLGATKRIKLDTIDPESTLSTIWNDTAPTGSVFSVGTSSDVNASGTNYIAYLFASLGGVSKVGSFSHTSGADTDVNCNFSGGARFVLIKNTDSGGHWITLDAERGIVAGNDPWLRLNSTSAESTIYDVIDPLSSGFTVAGAGLLSTGSYIFYAIA